MLHINRATYNLNHCPVDKLIEMYANHFIYFLINLNT